MNEHLAIATQAQPETVALFVSDLHLSVHTPRTTAAFFEFLRQHAQRTQRLYLLGDIFEYWAGDDDLDEHFNQSVVNALHTLTQHGTRVYWIAGNRDFLVGDTFAAASGLNRLADPSVIDIAGQPVLLTHGDAYCTDDHDYQRFRAQVRDARWQGEFLAKPLTERKQIIARMREGSRAAQREKSMAIMDVNPETMNAVFSAYAVQRIIHGHTHRPALHRSAGGLRHVLPDWDLDHAPHRGGWLAVDLQGEFHAHPIT